MSMVEPAFSRMRLNSPPLALLAPWLEAKAAAAALSFPGASFAPPQANRLSATTDSTPVRIKVFKAYLQVVRSTCLGTEQGVQRADRPSARFMHRGRSQHDL